MKYKAIMFDLDGTLLPMDMKEFTNGYFKDLYGRLAGHGIQIAVKDMVDWIWAGTAAMVKNDGSRRNDEVFWERFGELAGPEAELERIREECDAFYGAEFVGDKKYTQDNPLAVEAVELARKAAVKVILATNPLFPMTGQKTRLSWVGLKPEDFDLVTSYETDYYCKPNPAYYTHICELQGLDPVECLMIGNDEHEDMYAATKAGLNCYLVTDCCIPSEEHPWTGAKGTFKDLIAMLKNM